MNYKKKYRKIIDELIKKSFPELKGKKIFITESRNTKYKFSAAVSYWIFFMWIITSPKTRKFSESTLKGLFAHELSHISIIIKMNLFEKFKFISWIWSKKVKIKFERDSDLMAIKKGYAKGLYYQRLSRINSRDKHAKRLKKLYMSLEEIKSYAKKIGEW